MRLDQSLRDIDYSFQSDSERRGQFLVLLIGAAEDALACFLAQKELRRQVANLQDIRQGRYAAFAGVLRWESGVFYSAGCPRLSSKTHT